MIDEALLATLMQAEATSGDELALSRLLEDLSLRFAPRARTLRAGNTLVVFKGAPRLAVFAHVDSVGFTLGYDRQLIAVGGPSVEGVVAVRSTVGDQVYRGHAVCEDKEDRLFRLADGEGPPGTRWVYDTPPAFGPAALQGAYLDNRFGVYTALRLLDMLPDVCVAFTAAEEVSGRGALEAGRILYERSDIRRALVADITWATPYVRPGKGPALSLRDAFVPRKAYFDAVRAAAEGSGVPFQIEIESAGSSDGGMLERSGFGIDWVFVGAPENGYHTATETLVADDAVNMIRLFAHLVATLSA